MSRKHLIRITCEAPAFLSLDEFEPIQGELKALTEKRYEKLKNSLLRLGFSFPCFIWRHGKKNYVCDGTQRHRAIGRMLDEGYELEGNKLPVVFVKAKNMKQAKELVLAATSEYGSYDEESLYQFITEGDLDWADLKPWADFPQIRNMGTLEKGWFDGEFQPNEPKGGGKTRFLHVCPACGHEFETGESS